MFIEKETFPAKTWSGSLWFSASQIIFSSKLHMSNITLGLEIQAVSSSSFMLSVS